MVRDLHLPVEIAGVPTVREADGLALSSRNARLTPEDRAAAAVLKRALDHGARLLRQGGTANRRGGRHRGRDRGGASGARRPRGHRGRARASPMPADRSSASTAPGPFGIMVSARFGDVLLIDQREVAAPPTACAVTASSPPARPAQPQEEP